MGNCQCDMTNENANEIFTNEIKGGDDFNEDEGPKNQAKIGTAENLLQYASNAISCFLGNNESKIKSNDANEINQVNEANEVQNEFMHDFNNSKLKNNSNIYNFKSEQEIANTTEPPNINEKEYIFEENNQQEFQRDICGEDGPSNNLQVNNKVIIQEKNELTNQFQDEEIQNGIGPRNSAPKGEIIYGPRDSAPKERTKEIIQSYQHSVESGKNIEINPSLLVNEKEEPAIREQELNLYQEEELKYNKEGPGDRKREERREYIREQQQPVEYQKKEIYQYEEKINEANSVPLQTGEFQFGNINSINYANTQLSQNSPSYNQNEEHPLDKKKELNSNIYISENENIIIEQGPSDRKGGISKSTMKVEYPSEYQISNIYQKGIEKVNSGEYTFPSKKEQIQSKSVVIVENNNIQPGVTDYQYEQKRIYIDDNGPSDCRRNETKRTISQPITNASNFYEFEQKNVYKDDQGPTDCRKEKKITFINELQHPEDENKVAFQQNSQFYQFTEGSGNDLNIGRGEYQFQGVEEQFIEPMIQKEEANMDMIGDIQISTRAKKKSEKSYMLEDNFYAVTKVDYKGKQGRLEGKNIGKNEGKIVGKNEIRTEKRFEGKIEEGQMPYDTFSSYILTQINRIRENPRSFINIIEKAKSNIIKGKGGRLVYKSKVKVALNKGEEAFNNAIAELNLAKPMQKLKYSPQITVAQPTNETDFKDKNYLSRKVNQLISGSLPIKAYWRDIVSDPEACLILMIVDDNGKETGQKRNVILDPFMQFMGISSSENQYGFSCYMTFAKY